MFGFKQKELNETVLLPNLAHMAMDVWLYEDTFKPDELLRDPWFSWQSRTEEHFTDHIMAEKLALAAAFCGLVLIKTLKRPDLVPAFFDALDALRKDSEIPLRFKAKAKEYVGLFTELSPREAGTAAEDKFSMAVFGDAPGEHEVNARYRLYKELTNFQRVVILKSQAVIKASR
jgi:hypothetical protein